MPTYEDIKSEMIAIANVLKQYPEALQEKVFDILIQNYIGELPRKDEICRTEEMMTNQEEQKQVEINSKKIGKKSRNSSSSASKDSFKIVKELNLKGVNGAPSFDSFYSEKMPKTYIEFNVVSIYYLTKILGVSPVTIDHVYTCYKEVNRPVPGNLMQSLYDTSSSRYGYINHSQDGYTIPVRGENFVEHDLPRKKDKK